MRTNPRIPVIYPSGTHVQIFSGNYGGGSPTQTPTATAAIAYDLDSPYDIWVWNGSAWV